MCVTSGRERFDYFGAALSGRIGVHDFAAHRDTTTLRHFMARLRDFREDAITTRLIDVTHVHFDPGPAGDAVDGSREDFTDSDCAYGVNGAGRPGGGFDGQGDLSGGEKGVFARGHQHSACMAAFAFDPYLQSRRRGDCGDDADWNAPLLEQRPLLDVQLDEG